MPFARPTLTQLRSQIAADIGSSLPGVDGLLRFSNMGVLGSVLAKAVNGLYGYLDWIARQCTPFTATGEFLEAWAALKGVNRKAATPSTGAATFAASGTTSVPAGTAFVRSDGALFTSTAGVSAAGGSVIVPLEANVAGSAGNGAVGLIISLSSGISGVSSQGAISMALTGGADLELDADLRTRMLEAYAAPAQGGATSDYVSWAEEVAGVTRAWVAPSGNGAGTVVVYFMMDASEAAFGGFPQGSDGVASGETRDTAATGDQLAVANYIFNGRQPVTPLVYAVAPKPNTVTLTIAGISGASADTKAAIAAAVTAALESNASPGGVTNTSSIEAGIAAISGAAGFIITDIAASHGTVSPGVAGNITANAGYLSVAGAITYT
jgi:uncharacterized phage protein gp47/JayE